MKPTLACFMALALCIAPASAQRTAGIGTVTGKVFCDDTNAPARMASVTLEPAAAVDVLRTEGAKKVSSYAHAVPTLLDGSFSIRNVAPGTYYVIASAPGYISPVTTLLAAEKAPDDATKAKLAAEIPQVTVQGSLPVSVNITLVRGAAVSGTVLYDDGSPASGLHVSLLIKKNGKWVAPPSVFLMDMDSYGSAQTDDRGNFRISGMTAAQYVVQVELNSVEYWIMSGDQGNMGESSSSIFSLSIYSGNKTRAKDAKPFELRQGDEQDGEDIQIPISHLHTVKGEVLAQRDGHALNGGKVTLLYPDDKTEAASTSVGSSAEFDFAYVPDGDYLLHVEDASDTDYEEVPNAPNSVPPSHTVSKVVRKYGSGEISIHVDNDMSNVSVSVPDLKKADSGN